MKKKTNEEKKNELTVLTLQTKLARHTLNSHHGSLIVKKEETN
jgi:hypothetical protein